MANVVTTYIVTQSRTARAIKARLPRRADRVCMATYSQNELSMPGSAQVVHPFRRPERSQSRNVDVFSPGDTWGGQVSFDRGRGRPDARGGPGAHLRGPGLRGAASPGGAS